MSKSIKKARILVVDDESSLRDICQDALEDIGYTVFQAPDGEAALEFLAREKIDLVISDLRMPVINGLELLKEIKSRGYNVAFLVMTGFGTIETAVESMKMGASDYLPKPFNINHLTLKVEKVLKERQTWAERKELSNLVRMLNLSSALNSQLDLQSLVNEFLYHLQKNFAPSALVLFLLEEGPESELSPSAIRGNLLGEDPVLFTRIRDICEDVLHQQEPQLIGSSAASSLETEQLPYLRTDETIPEYSLMTVPLLHKFKKIGVVALVREANRTRYSFSELQLLTVFSSHTASSLDNARLYGQMHELTMQVIRSYAKAVEAKDIYTRGHSDRVAFYAAKLGHKLGLTSGELDRLYTAGVLHDIGKIGIPDQILNKASSLTEPEYTIMKKHPEIGRSILSKVNSLGDVLPIIYHHHERMDGKGYPRGLSGSQIPFLARLISVVDSFEAMTSDRAYRNALAQEKVIKILEEGAGSQWDPELVEAWLSIVRTEDLEHMEFEPSNHILHTLI